MQPYHLSIKTGRGGDGLGEGVSVGGDGGDVAINFNYVRGSPGIARLMSVRARHAEYNSARKDAPSSCLEGTRVDILADIMSWLVLADDNVHPVYWLNGLAGIGKSTIATTVAERAEEKGMLGATFFFSRGDQALCDPYTVFPTLAFQLANSDNRFKSVIAEALEKDEGIEDRSLLRQLEGLIVNPFLRIRRKRRPTLIILDALDECEERGATDILRLLFSHATRIPFLRIFVTSRPEFHISSVFNQFENCAKTILHNVEASVIRQDIELYIRTELEKIPGRLGLSMPADWTTEAEKHALVERSGKLFIFAATCIRFIGDDRVLAPREHLTLILGTQPLEGGDLSEVTPYKELDLLYTRLLRKSLSDSNPRLIQNRFQIVVGSIVLLRQPLPLHSLARFVENDIGTLKNVFRHLQSVMIPPYDENDAPRIYHPSFVDFITNPSRCTMVGFLITAVPVQEQRHALRCFHLMKMCLKRDVAGIEDPSLLNSEVDGFNAKVANALPLEVQYACRFWGSHLSHVEIGDEKVMGVLEEFAMRSILWWIEAMSLLGSVHTVASSVREAYRWAVSSKCKSALVTLLADVRRFILAHAEVIRASALHVYHSALPFTPHDTVLYKVYCKETRHSIRVLQGMDPQWPRTLASLHGHHFPVSSIACSRDGLQMASGSYDHSIRLWDVTSGLLIAILEGHSSWVNSVAFSPDGLRLASGSFDLCVRLWDATSGIPTAVLEGHSGDVQSVAFSPDGLRLASGSYDCSTRLWDTSSGILIAILEGHTGWVNSVAFSPDGSQLASGSNDSSIRLWDATLGTPISILRGNTGWVRSIAFSPDGSRLAGSDDSSVRLWDTTSGTPIALLSGHTDLVHSVAFSPDGLRLASGSSDRLIQLWDATSGASITILRGHTGRVNSIVFTPDGLLLAADSDISSVQLWDVRLDVPTAVPEGHSGSVRSLAFSPDGLLLASGSRDCSIWLWDAILGTPIANLRGHTGFINSVAFSPDGLRLASASNDASVQLWDTTSGATTATLGGHLRGVHCVAFSPDGLRLVSGSQDGSIRLWDAISGSSVALLTGHSGSVRSIAFSPDGLRLGSGSDDCSIRLWDAILGMPIAILNGHSRLLRSVTFSPDGLQLASASSDSSVRLWDAVSGKPITILSNDVGGAYCLAFSVDAQTLIAKSGTATFLWDLTSQPPHRLDTESSMTSPSSVDPIPPIWSCDGRWITMRRLPGNDVRRICYIPPYYSRNIDVEVMGSSLQSRVAFGCIGGRVILLDVQHCMQF